MDKEILLLQDRVRNTIELGESHFREFKSAMEGPLGSKKPRPVTRICADIGEALVAFANADGGELIVGVENDGTITGIPHKDQDIESMFNAGRSHVHQDSHLPILQSTKLVLDGKTIVFFSVAKGTTEIYQLSDGRCVKRKDKNTEPENIKRNQFERDEIKSREFDRSFVDGATVNDLDLQFLQNLADSYLRGLSIERYLQQIDVAEYATGGLRLRMAALLLFAKDTQKWHPRSQVRILKVAGTQLKSGEQYNVASERIVQGNIFDLLLKSWEELRFFLAYKTELGPGARFEQKYIYPEQACREALVNALAHRDYSTHVGIDVFIFDDRMEIKSPGALLSTLTIEDISRLQGMHESRNALIARVLRENKFMRELGEGMKRIFESMEQNELEKPRLFSDSKSFVVTLPNKSVFSEQQEQWFSVFKQFDLTPLQKKLVVSGMNDIEMSPADIYKAMNTEDRNTYDREVTGLRISGILVEIRTNAQANRYAKQQRINKSLVPRFKIEVPRSTTITDNSNLCVFVRNLPYNIGEGEVQLLFETCGKVSRVVFPALPFEGEFRYGFVYYYEQGAAQRAINELNNRMVKGRTIQVRKYIPKIS